MEQRRQIEAGGPGWEPTAYWLSMHVPYACRHAGACCSSGWPIPLEQARLGPIERAATEHRLRLPDDWLHRLPNQPADVAGVLADRDGHCVFHLPAPAANRDRRCAIQGALGHEALPTACQHFPRECLLDDRGLFVTLSHYCPTAASLLFSHDGAVEIVAGPSPVPGGRAEGFDARGAWPPQLRLGVLMDLASYTAWEGHLVNWLGGRSNPDGRWSPEEALQMLERHAAALAGWQPARGSLLDAIRALAADAPVAARVTPERSAERALIEVADGVTVAGGATVSVSPPMMSDDQECNPATEAGWRDAAMVVNRWLAAHAFASWTAYQGNGIVVQVRKLRLALAVLRRAVMSATRDGSRVSTPTLTGAIRQADLQLVHLIDREALARALEQPAPIADR